MVEVGVRVRWTVSVLLEDVENVHDVSGVDPNADASGIGPTERHGSIGIACTR